MQGATHDDFLHRRRVSEKTEKTYPEYYHDLLRAFPRLLSNLVPVGEIDRLLDAHLHNMFFNGNSIHEARYALYATCWARILAARQLPRAQPPPTWPAPPSPSCQCLHTHRGQH